VLVIAAAGTTAAVVMGGGENGNSIAGLDRNDPALTNDTRGGDSTNQPPIPIAAAGTTEAGGARTDPPVRDDPEIENQNIDSLNVEPPTAVFDIAAVDRDLIAILDSVDVNPAAMRARAETHYNDQRLPAETRAFAAAVVGDTFFAENEIESGCSWYRRASALDRASTNAYPAIMNAYGCTQ